MPCNLRKTFGLRPLLNLKHGSSKLQHTIRAALGYWNDQVTRDDTPSTVDLGAAGTVSHA